MPRRVVTFSVALLLGGCFLQGQAGAVQLWPSVNQVVPDTTTPSGYEWASSTVGVFSTGYGTWPSKGKSARFWISGSHDGGGGGNGVCQVLLDGVVVATLSVTSASNALVYSDVIEAPAVGHHVYQVILQNVVGGTLRVRQVGAEVVIDDEERWRNLMLWFIQGLALTGCFIYGGVTWRLVVLAKNQRDFW